LAALLKELPDGLYPYHASTYYWKAGFVPHGKIMGSVGMRLATLSKYPITDARRYALPQMPGSWLRQQFNFKRAVLSTSIQMESGPPLHVFNTHLDAFTAGTDTVQRQVEAIAGIIRPFAEGGERWLLGGDFNALAPGQWEWLDPSYQPYFEQESQLASLYEAYSAVPTLQQLSGPERQRWLTYFPNDPAFERPAYTLDYFFYGELLEKEDAAVLRGSTLDMSDHLPVKAVFTVRE